MYKTWNTSLTIVYTYSKFDCSDAYVVFNMYIVASVYILRRVCRTDARIAVRSQSLRDLLNGYLWRQINIYNSRNGNQN